MPATSKAKNPRGIEITFTEENHKYSSIIEGKEVTYVSVTTFISKFFKPFDPTGEITKKYARKHGLTVESVKAEWKKKADESCIYGTRVHETCEDVLNGGEFRNKPKDLKEKLAFENAVEIAKKVKDRSEILGIEKIIFDDRMRIAGTIDLLIRAKKDGKIWICDWKTNGKIDKENTFRNFGTGVLSDYPDTNYYHYQLQLSLYEYILKEVGYINKDEKVERCLFHITENGVKPYVLEDCSDRIRSMMDYFNVHSEDFFCK